MQVLERAKTPNGIDIQIEDWSGELTIGAYPIAKASRTFQRAGERFRLTIASNEYSGYTNEQVRADYEMLKTGEKTIEDLAEHFWDSDDDKRLLGMEV